MGNRKRANGIQEEIVQTEPAGDRRANGFKQSQPRRHCEHRQQEGQCSRCAVYRDEMVGDKRETGSNEETAGTFQQTRCAH